MDMYIRNPTGRIILLLHVIIIVGGRLVIGSHRVLLYAADT